MASPSAKVIELRQLLAERFGQAKLPVEESYATGLPALDEVGIPRAALTEIVSTISSGPGGALLLYGLLHSAIRRGERIILIDGKDAFAPKGLPVSDRKRLLWMRCHDTWETIKVADLAIRDGNVPLVILLLSLNPVSELKRILETARVTQPVRPRSLATLWLGCPRPGPYSAQALTPHLRLLAPSRTLVNPTAWKPVSRITLGVWKKSHRFSLEKRLLYPKG